MPNVSFSGVSLAGVQPGLLSKVTAAAKAVGATSIVVTSGKRPPGPGNDVKDSNHITGNALDGYAVINGKQVPLGTAFLPVAAKFGLRSGDVAGFDPKTQGGYDPVHIDDGANVGGVKTTSPSLSQPPAALASAISTAAAQYKVPADVLTGIWRVESASSFPNPYENKSGYGGLFGTTNWDASTQDQANLAASILSHQITEHNGNLAQALSSYSGGGYASVPGQTTSGAGGADPSLGNAGPASTGETATPSSAPNPMALALLAGLGSASTDPKLKAPKPASPVLTEIPDKVPSFKGSDLLAGLPMGTGKSPQMRKVRVVNDKSKLPKAPKKAYRSTSTTLKFPKSDVV